MDMIVAVNGTAQLAERACRMVFGEDAGRGPVRPAPETLLALLKDWPGRTDEPLRVALELPFTFDIEKDMRRNGQQAVVLVVNRITILHEGRAVGYALRTDALGLAALALYDETWAHFYRRVRQAH